MRVAVWKTGHEIADTVAQATFDGLRQLNGRNRFCETVCIGDCNVYKRNNTLEETVNFFDVHICYGILRGTADVFKSAKHWFEIDRGYTNPHHYSGNYRISYRGTQARWHEGIPTGSSNGRTSPFEGVNLGSSPSPVTIEPWRKDDPSKPVLVCPPTLAVDAFFGLGAWIDWLPENRVIRDKGDSTPIDWDAYRAVITFNSSVGWEAIRRGIPCLSDVNHSLVGSFYGETDLEKLIQKSLMQPDRRQELFDTMAAHQFTLEEIKQGKAWPLINPYVSGSVMTTGKPSQPMSASIPSKSTLSALYQSNT